VLPTDRAVLIEDIYSGLGNSTSGGALGTDLIPGSVRLDGVPVVDVDYHDNQGHVRRLADQLNRVVYDFLWDASTPDQPTLSAGQHTLTMQFSVGTRIGCFANGHQEAHIIFPPDTGNFDTTTINLSVRCP
jgi:hypothetical protein